MPRHQSAIKRVRQNEKRRQRNQSQRSKMKTLITKAMETTEKEEAEKAFKEASSYLEKWLPKIWSMRTLLHAKSQKLLNT